MTEDTAPPANPASPANELAPLATLATGQVLDARDVRGRFLTGNVGGGRPKGSKNRLTELVMAALTADFADHGASAIESVRIADPAAYLKLVSAFVPRELVVQRERDPGVDIESLSLSEFLELIERLEREKSIRRALLDAER